MDELKKALVNTTKSPVSGIGPGTGERGVFVYNKETRQVERFEKKAKYVEVYAPTVIKDEIIGGIESPLTGEKYYSRSQLMKHYKENGYEVTGGDHLTHRMPDPFKADYNEIREDVERALNDIRWGNVPISEHERQLILDEERQWENYKQRQKY